MTLDDLYQAAASAGADFVRFIAMLDGWGYYGDRTVDEVLARITPEMVADLSGELRTAVEYAAFLHGLDLDAFLAVPRFSAEYQAARNTAKVYLIARDEGMDRAMMFKLANG